MSIRGIESRISALEKAQGARDVCYVARRSERGELVPARPGTRLAPYVAVLPAVCATAEEWARLHTPAMANP